MNSRYNALRLLVIFAFLLGTAACTGADVDLGNAGVPLAGVDASSEVTQITAGPQPVCLADTDCAALAGGPCTLALCEPQSKRCVVVPRPDFAVCDDALPCSAESMC